MKQELIKKLLDALKEYELLGIADQIDYKKFYLYSLITHSTAIEGSTVTEIENQLLFDEGITAKGRSLQEQMMNLDLKAAYEHSMQLAHQHKDFSVEMLKNLSALVMKNTGASYNTAQGSFDASKGDLRLVGVTAGIGGRSYMNYQKVPAKLEEVCKQLNQRRSELSNLDDIIDKYLFSFDAHYQLVTIHPWVDGNGRMSRLVMNHLQYEFGLVPVKIHVRNISKEIEEYKKSQDDDPIKVTPDPIKSSSDPIKERLYQAVLQDGTLNYAGYAAIVGASEATVKRRLGELKKEGAIIRVGSKKTGHWENNKEK